MVVAVGRGLQLGEVARVPQHAEFGRAFVYRMHDLGADALVQRHAQGRVRGEEAADVAGQRLGKHRGRGHHAHAAVYAAAA